MNYQKYIGFEWMIWIDLMKCWWRLLVVTWYFRVSMSTHLCLSGICPPFFHAVRHWGATCFHAFNDAIVLVLAVQSVRIVQNCYYRTTYIEYVYHSTYIYTCVHIFICTFLHWVIFDVHHQSCMCVFFFLYGSSVVSPVDPVFVRSGAAQARFFEKGSVETPQQADWPTENCWFSKIQLLG